jgi:thiamine kinase-like enzyme
MVKLIPKITEKINKVLEKKELFPKETPEDFIKKTGGKKHRYSTVCQDKKGKKFIFYARLHDSLYEKERMITEVKIAEVLKKRNYQFLPKYIDGKIEKDFEWLQREYFNETPLEDKKEIEKLKRKLSKKEILKICIALLNFQKIKISYFPFLKKFNLKKYLELPKQIEEKGIFPPKKIEELKKFLKENLKILKRENKYLCHGDFQIGNIISDRKTVKIIDLESARISNFAFDICFLWARLWKERETAKKLLDYFFKILPETKRGTFKILFRLNSLFIGFHSFVQEPREYDKKTIKKRKKFFFDVLNKALISFEELKRI